MYAWEAEQCYERFCNLYVALTRAKHATYCILNPVKDTWQCTARFADWIRDATSRDGIGTVNIGEETYVKIYESGAWLSLDQKKPRAETAKVSCVLQPGIPRLERRIASGSKSYEPGLLLRNARGTRFGNVVHQLFEKITWLDELPSLGDEASARLVKECLEQKGIRAHFERPKGEYQLLREQPIETRINGEWVSGVIDRALVLLDSGVPSSISVIDFKTDVGETASSLRESYHAQLDTYRDALARIYKLPREKISCYLLSTALQEMIGV